MKRILAIFLMIGTLISAGCLEQKLPSENELRNSETVDSFCKANGYEYGSTKYLRSSEQLNLFDEFGGNLKVIELGDYGVMCVKVKKEYGIYRGSDYKEYTNRIIYVEK